MFSLTFYGGVNEIGGNKVLLDEEDTRLFFDFGTPFARRSLFFEEYLKPRSSAGLLDLLEMGLLPFLPSLYRPDLFTTALRRRLQHRPPARELTLDGVFLSHAHLDHSGYISFLRQDIPIYTTSLTAFIAKAIQDSAPDDFEKEVCYCILRQEKDGVLSTIPAREEKAQQRCFHMVDSPRFSLAALEFWEGTPGTRKLDCQPPGHTPKAGFLPFRYFPVDHSIFGAAAFAVETSSGWVVYTGDLRFHGKWGHLSEEFVQAAARLKPAVLVGEGTNLDSPVSAGEEEVYARALETVKQTEALVIADFGPRNVERLLTFCQIAQDTCRRLVIMSRDAYLLQAMKYLSPQIPDIAADPVIHLYQETKGRLDRWENQLRRDYARKLVEPEEIRAHPEEYILCFSFFDLNELPSLMPRPGSLYVYSSSEVYNEEAALDMKRLHCWLQHFGITGVGLPRKVQRGDWQIPPQERGFHASGHASGKELLSLIRNVSPRTFIPLHTENPRRFVDGLQGTGIEVLLPEAEKEMRFS